MTDHDDMLARVHLYFDGELAKADEAELLVHVATCARCRDELSDLSGFDAVLSRPPREAEVVPIRRRRWIPVAIAAGVAAAAAVIAVAVWPRASSAPAIALGPTRAIEARFDAGPFAAYRPYAVVRGAAAREAVPLDALAELERRGDWPGLAAALAASGDLARTNEIATKHELPVADRAAIALASGEPERALELLDDAPATPEVAWNRALAARELGLGAVARESFVAVVTAGEPGWRDEAARQVAALDDARGARTGFADFQKRALAMIAGTGPAITIADAARYPAFARMYFHDAVRVAGDAAALDALRPIADALDRATGTTHARAAIDRIHGFDTRAKFAARYRALVARTLDAAGTAALVDELTRAGGDVDDLFVGAVILAGQTRARLAELAKVVPDDPWFQLVIQREQLAAARASEGSAAVAGRLRAAADGCAATAGYRCAQLALDAAEASAEAGAADAGETYARRARALYAAAVAPAQEDRVLAYLGELERHRDRRALASATFREVELHAPDCVLDRYAKIGRAKLAVAAGKADDARKLLPTPGACGAPPDELGLTAAVDLARDTHDTIDLDRARAWVAAAKTAGDPRLAALADVGAARLDHDVAALKAAAARPVVDLDDVATRAWATAALVDQAARDGRWADAAEAARAEIDAPAPTGCALIANVDGTRRAVVARGRDGRWLDETWLAPIGELDAKTFVPPKIVAALAGCEHVDVIARPPLHGRTDLLPPAMPWAFAGGTRSGPAPARSRVVIVADTVPSDPAFRLPRLAPTTSFPPDAVVLRGEAATPARVLAEIADASYVEVDAHGIAEADVDAAFLALSPEPSGRFTLTAADLRAAKLRAAPVVVLAACRGARVAPYLHRRWSLPDAFLAAGARAVIATDVDVPDPAAPAVFGAIRDRIARGESPAAAVAAVRGAADPGSWVTRIAVFQ